MKIHLFGAAGAGVTALGPAPGAALGMPYFDGDAYFWGPPRCCAVASWRPAVLAA